MRVVAAEDPEALALRDDLTGRAMDTDAAGLMTANVWLWAVERPDPDPRAVVSAVLALPEFPGRTWLEPDRGSAPWVELPAEAAIGVAVLLLTGGQSLEVPAFHGESEAAAQFAARLLAWAGHPVAAMASWEHRPGGVSSGFNLFRVPHWFDEGLALVGPQRAALLWFVGSD
ncbi:MAG: hypothetical protein J0I06_23080 [Planctomycetes bacterium]|nr:hypothetical protein [Planctomycetota bacterium]